MIAFLVSLCLLAGTWWIVKDGLIRGARVRLAGIDTNALGLTVVAVLASMWFFGPLFGLMLVLAIALHEYGHVLAYRICGRREASFVLMPLFGAMTSAAPVWNQDEQVFVSLMGPAIGLAPMCLALSGADLLGSTWPLGAMLLQTFGLTVGVLNFLNLLPLWPLDGGKILQTMTAAVAPGQVRNVSILMSGLALVAALKMQSLIWMLFVAMSVRGLFQSAEIAGMQRPMAPRRTLLAGAAYLATAVAYYQAGGSFLWQIIG